MYASQSTYEQRHEKVKTMRIFKDSLEALLMILLFSFFQPSIDARTRYLTKILGKQLTEGGCIKKLQDLCTHLKHHPQAKGVAVKVRLGKSIYTHTQINYWY